MDDYETTLDRILSTQSAVPSDSGARILAARRGELFAVATPHGERLVIARSHEDALERLAWIERGTLAREHPDGLVGWAKSQRWSATMLRLQRPGVQNLGHPRQRPALALVLAVIAPEVDNSERSIEAWSRRDLLWPDDDGTRDVLAVGTNIGWRTGNEIGQCGVGGRDRMMPTEPVYGRTGLLNRPTNEAWGDLARVGFVTGERLFDVLTIEDAVRVAVEAVESIPSWLSADGGVAVRIGAQADGCEVFVVRRIYKNNQPQEAYYTSVQRTSPGAEKSSAYVARRFERLETCVERATERLREDLKIALQIAESEGHGWAFIADLNERLAEVTNPDIEGECYRLFAVQAALKAGDRDRAEALARRYRSEVGRCGVEELDAVLKG